MVLRATVEVKRHRRISFWCAGRTRGIDPGRPGKRRKDSGVACGSPRMGVRVMIVGRGKSAIGSAPHHLHVDSRQFPYD